ncbi:MAG: T9SS type A sorting domain-containing protein [Bacteroidales bacterium]|nr:T9SS type A sorting domain-containing protein [Bacteroidales bacterium]
MKKFLLSILLSIFCLTLSISSFAQTSLSVPNGGFENWSTGSGYGVSVLFFSIPVYDNYVYPNDWNYLAYHVNQEVDLGFGSTTVNTDVPLLKVSQETSGVPAGSSALKMESFMLSDIINSTVYSLAESSIDSSLTSMVLPTVLSTGQLNLDNFIPIMDDLMGSLNDLEQLLGIFNGQDLNNYVTGGVALNGFAPTKLTGMYKYTSAIGGDQGGVVLIGTRYNPETQMREAVGGGYTTDLTDVSTYTQFELGYNTLHEIDSAYEDVAADSLIIMLISSASNNRQQGSALYLDNLMLVHETPVIPDEPDEPDEPVADTCDAASGLALIFVDTTQAVIAWSGENAPNNWQYGYNVAGFDITTEQLYSTSDTSITLENLVPDTEYDLYLRAQCNDTLFSDWTLITFRTDTIPIPTDTTTTDTTATDTTGMALFTDFGINIYPNPAHGLCQLRFSNEIPTLVQIYSADGKRIMNIQPTESQMTLTLPNAGIFFVRCEMKKGASTHTIINQ